MAIEAVTFAAGNLRLEGALHLPSGVPPFPAVAVCHPHPLYGGDMNNPLVVGICEGLVAAGIAALRFNFPPGYRISTLGLRPVRTVTE